MMKWLIGWAIVAGILGGVAGITAAHGSGVCDDNTCVLVPIGPPHNVVACVAPYSPYYPANPAAYPVCH